MQVYGAPPKDSGSYESRGQGRPKKVACFNNTFYFEGAGMSRGNKGGSSSSGGRRTAQDFIDDMKRLDDDNNGHSNRDDGNELIS